MCEETGFRLAAPPRALDHIWLRLCDRLERRGGRVAITRAEVAYLGALDVEGKLTVPVRIRTRGRYACIEARRGPTVKR